MKSPILQFYDEQKPIVLSVDSSKDGLGAVILQNGAPVAYASKSLTESQQNYAQIEKEALAIAFGCQRFHQYLYGKFFIVESDHRPLEAIFKKPLNKCPLRLQRLRINLQNYDFDIRYKPGSQMYIADTLSRASYIDNNFDIIESAIEAQVNLLNAYNYISPQKFEMLKLETNKDLELQELVKIVNEGFPSELKNLNDIIKPYWRVKDELNIRNGVIFKGDQMIIPKSMRTDILKKLHYNHLGIEKTLLRAKEIVYWPFINKEITDLIKNCPACLRFQNSNQSETLINKEVPEIPWHTVAGDLFHLFGKEYLLIVDYYSKYPEVCCLENNTTYVNVIKHVKSIFARHGKPSIFYSDQGPQFVNSEFQKFLSDWEIEHRTSTPRYPQSNGFIERYVQTIKKTIKKALYDNKDIYLTLLELRNTPISRDIPSPAQLLFGRRLRGILPTTEDLLKPVYTNQNYKRTYVNNQRKQKFYYNRKAKNLSPLSVNDNVMVQISSGIWEPGKIIKIDTDRPRSYFVQLLRRDNKIYLRNRKFLRPCDDNLEVHSGNMSNKDDYDLILDNYIAQNVQTGSNSNNYNSNETTGISEAVSLDNNAGPVNVNQKTTRSGRVINRPNYLKDYV